MTWHDIDDIAEALIMMHPEVDPLTIRFTQLRDWVALVPEWDDDIHLSNEAKLEAIQMEWYELFKDEHEG
jgi:FeS assembly protein IscX